MTSTTLSQRLGKWWQSTTYVADGPQVREERFSAALRSAVDGACFHAHFAVVWQGGDDPDSGSRQLRKFLQDWAEDIARGFSITRLDRLANELNDRLGRSGYLHDTNIYLTRASVALFATPEARQAALLWDEVQRQLAIERLRQETELAQLEYLRTRIFSQPSTARVYWLKHHPEALDALLDDRFDQIAARLGAAGETTHLVIAHLVEQFLTGLDDSEQQYLLHQLGQVFSSFGRQDLGGQLEPPAGEGT
ncbi:hypothetical protein ACNTMW_01350 [Planosporangium sp. 12N6]|uniref:hypothetical protein n=1 Tax=Planosporangium spinosum TaxID=3402278 RepID=UPI003CF81417